MKDGKILVEIIDAENLREANARYTDFLNNLQDAIFVFDNNTYIYANQAAADMLNYDSPEDLVGLPSYSLVALEDREMVKQRTMASARGEDVPKRCDLRLIRRDGSVVFTEVNITRIINLGIPASLAVHRDITDYRKMEEQLKETRNYLEKLLDYANSPIIVWSPSFKITRFNHAFERLTGYGSDEVIGKELGMLFPEESQNKALRNIKYNLSGEHWENVEIPILCKDRSTKTVLWNSANIYAEGGAITATIAQGQDITERKQMETERERSQIRLESLHELVLQLDTAQTIDQTSTIAMDVIRSLYGTEFDCLALLEGDVLVKLPTPGVTTPPIRLSLDSKDVMVKVVKETRTIYIKDTANDPDYFEVDAIPHSALVVPLKVKDRVVGVLNIKSNERNAYASDDIKLAEILANHISATLNRISVTEKQQHALEVALREEVDAERRQLAMVKMHFYSSATHEIRTPLTSIKGYTELIQNALQSGDTVKLPVYFDAVRRNADRLTRLTDDLLDTQRIAEGKMEISKSYIKTGDLLRNLVEESTPGLMLRRQTLEIRDEFDSAINVDEDRIIQVLANLVDNASKFSPPVAAIRLRVERRGGEALFSVHDDGVGLAEEDVPKLFTPFPGIAVKGNIESTGLGLSISKSIVELHGGRIWAESRGSGNGSTFLFTIPNVGS
jgi:PAS domain S-box-containing protein